MSGLSTYTSASGWVVQSESGLLVIDSIQPCQDHREPDRACSRCYDGPMVEEDYYLDGSQVVGINSGLVVATCDYATDGSPSARKTSCGDCGRRVIDHPTCEYGQCQALAETTAWTDSVHEIPVCRTCERAIEGDEEASA